MLKDRIGVETDISGGSADQSRDGMCLGVGVQIGADKLEGRAGLAVAQGRLRKTLEEAGLKDIIKTRFGVGYILEAE